METRCDWMINDANEVRCTNCNKVFSMNTWLEIAEENGDGPNYCPHCGAKSNLQVKE